MHLLLQTLIQAFSTHPDFKSLVTQINDGTKNQLICGLSGSSRQVLLASFYKCLQRPMCIVTHNLFSAQKIAEDLQQLLSKEEVLLYPANELIAAEAAVCDPEVIGQRIEVLIKYVHGFRGIVIVPYAGVRRFIAPKNVLSNFIIYLKKGNQIDVKCFLSRMVQLGYDRVDQTEHQGQMSVRGGIIDFYPLTSISAYRIELFDDEIVSIRTFCCADQRSVENVNQVTITPCKELVATQAEMDKCAELLLMKLQQQLSKMSDLNAKEQLQQQIQQEVSMLHDHIYFNDIYKYVELLYSEQHTLLDYLSEDTMLVLDEPVRLSEASKELERDELEWNTHLLERQKTLPGLNTARDINVFLEDCSLQTLSFSLFLRQTPYIQFQNTVHFLNNGVPQFHGQMNVFKTEMERWMKAGMRVLLLANKEERLDHMRRVLQDYNIERPELVLGYLQTGFEMSAIRLVVITEAEIFSHKQRKSPQRTSTMDNAERIKSYTELKIGDYVVHRNHGIGKYIGMGTLEVNGIHKDYLHVLYAGNDKLSVPIDQIDLVQKYVGSDEKRPKVHKLGGSEWVRVKNKVQNAVKDIAEDLVKLYAQRQMSPGYSFEKDTIEQQQFESMFPYEETPDQIRAIEEIKTDMEQSRPMDRLLCGDVGYGKTEVAIRAAFKAALEGKQVAILVPTTILAQQHVNTFRERFANYPFHIHVLSRFRSRKEQADTIKGIKQGIVDIVIGTHRLLSSEIVFKDLGLLIVDEEQRFGVTHKEKLKELKANVDVLTLTATPIPRTLHMSMLGVRDLSVIQTPPKNRFPVQTYVVEYSATLVREAIERELKRGGQVYYLYNRVSGIEEKARDISLLIPEARVAIGHGKMSEMQLEKTILEFLDGEYDVLVSTSIIETGVDIPNVNTLIVHDSDKMGLSQLYQLRGRVGRANRIAYAYFTYERDKVLTEVAEKRLQSIKEFTELGSGFKIAMRDLSIRGAGNLLGAEQHGFIASVGFDMYSQMLMEQMNKCKVDALGTHAKKEDNRITSVHLDIDAYLPSKYITDNTQKIEVYKKAASISKIEDIAELEEELIDRFGPLPQEVANLFVVTRLRVYGKKCGIESIAYRQQDVVLKFYKGKTDTLDMCKFIKTSSFFEKRIQFKKADEQEAMHIKRKGLGTEVEVVNKLVLFLENLQDAFQTIEEE